MYNQKMKLGEVQWNLYMYIREERKELFLKNQKRVGAKSCLHTSTSIV